MVYIHNGILVSYKEEWNHTICRKIDITGGGHIVKWNKSDTKTNFTSFFIYGNLKDDMKIEDLNYQERGGEEERERTEGKMDMTSACL